jgi:hypothetical protein
MIPVFQCELYDVPFELNSNGFYILLIDVNQGPPHLALVFCNKYFSVTVKSVSRGLSFQSKFQSLIRKELPLLFFEVEQTSVQKEIAEKLQMVFGEISPLSGDGKTCLAPVKRSIELIYTIDVDAKLVIELLVKLQNLKLIKAISSPNIKPGTFHLAPYNLQDVERHIKSFLK